RAHSSTPERLRDRAKVRPARSARRAPRRDSALLGAVSQLPAGAGRFSFAALFRDFFVRVFLAGFPSFSSRFFHESLRALACSPTLSRSRQNERASISCSSAAAKIFAVSKKPSSIRVSISISQRT